MKLIFLFFVAINILFFVWQSDSFNGRGKASADVLTAIPANVDKIILISEAEAIKAAKAAAAKSAEQQKEAEQEKLAALTSPSAKQKHTAKSYACYALGPFKEMAQASPIAVKLRELGAITDGRRQEKQVPTGFWVYLPAMDSWQDARKKVMALESQGMKDMFIMGRGSMKNAISVGLFSSERAARSRMSRLVEFGEDPQLQKQYSKTPEFWIDIDVEADQKQVVSAIEAIAKGLNQLELVTRKCKK